MTFAVSYVATAIVFIVIDTLWLTLMGNRLYRPLLGDMVLERFNVPAAIAFYLLYVIGVVVFAVLPALAAGRVSVAVGYGALFGFLAYATYDLTNLATLKNWPLTLSVIDMAWGTFVTAISAALGYRIAAVALKALAG